MKANFRRYFVENLEEQMKLPKNKKLIKEWNSIVKKEMNKKGSAECSNRVEERLTKYLVGDKELQKCLLGVEFTEQTEIATNNAILDISSMCRYTNKRLAKKYGIREEDMIRVECKNVYTYSVLTKNQKHAAHNGSLGCVVAFGGANDKYVKDTDCPVISTSKIPEDINPKYFSIYESGIEDGVLIIIEKAVDSDPLFFSEQGIINNYAEGLLRESDIRKHRNTYSMLFQLGKMEKTRTPYARESKSEFHNRIKLTIQNMIKESKSQIYDFAYPANPESRRERYVNNSTSKKLLYTPMVEDDLFSAIGGKPLRGENHIYSVEEFDPFKDCQFTVSIDKDIAELLDIPSPEVKFIKDVNSSYGHIYPSFHPRIESAKCLSPYMRKEIQRIFSKHYPEKGKNLSRRRLIISDKLQSRKKENRNEEFLDIKQKMANNISIFEIQD